MWHAEAPFPTSAMAGLRICLTDTNEVVRLSAAVTLARYPEHRKSVIAELLAAIGNRMLPTPLRIHALFQLEERHLTAREADLAAPVLKAAQHDADPKVQPVASRVRASLTSTAQK